MDEVPRNRLAEIGIDAVAAAMFGGALAFAWLKLVDWGIEAAGVVMIGFVIVFAGLRRVEPEAPTFALPEFHPEICIEPAPTDELLLGEDLADDHTDGGDELVLEDVLASIGPNSRVVQLFKPVDLPTAGELQASIDRHLRQGNRPVAHPDATDALHQALAELRRSLR